MGNCCIELHFFQPFQVVGAELQPLVVWPCNCCKWMEKAWEAVGLILLMVQKSGDAQLRLVVEITLHPWCLTDF